MITTSLFNKHGKGVTITKSSGATQKGSVILTHPTNIDVLRRAYIFKVTSPSGLIQSGDLMLQDSSYYLIATTEDNVFRGRVINTSGIAFRCNAELTSRRYASGSFTDIAGVINACLTSTKLYALDDRSYAIDEGGRRRSNEPRYYCYARASADIQENDKLTHGSRELKVLKDIDPYFADGVQEVSVVIVD